MSGAKRLSGSGRDNLALDGRSFVPNVLADPHFAADGVASGHDRDCWWAVVDPLRHPLGVWKKRVPRLAAYGRSAQALDAAIFTNGPMMGKRFGPTRKLTRRSAAWEFAKWTVAGAIGGLLVASGWGAPYLGGIGGVAIGVALASRRVFTNWLPCGAVYSHDSDIDDRRIFDDETHAWFGQFASDFASYRIAPGNLPPDVREGLGGLILIVRDFEMASTKAGDPAFNRDFAQLSKKSGVVAWGLVPLDRAVDATRSEHLEGVIVVVGGHTLDCEVAAARFCSIGARDAVAMDQSACIMMGTGRHFMIGPPPLHRQEMQLYGLCCR